MPFRLPFLMVAIYLLLLGSQAWAQNIDKQNIGPYKKHHRFGDIAESEPGEVLVKFRENFTNTDLKQFNQQVKAAATNRSDAIRAFHTYYKTSPKKKLVNGWQQLEIPSNATVTSFIPTAKTNSLIEKIEPNYKVFAAGDLSTSYTVQSAPNDPHYQDGHTQWWFNKTKADTAYNVSGTVYHGTSDVIVAVLDTGLMVNHPDFEGRTITGYNFINPGTSPDDDNVYIQASVGVGTPTPVPNYVFGHGTHAAGMIIANANNNQGVAGTGWNSHIVVMPVKVLNSKADGNIVNLGDGITWAADNNAAVINASLGVYGTSSYLEAAVTYAQGKGVLIVAAAGNDNWNMDPTSVVGYEASGNTIYGSHYLPACYSGVMCVGATNAGEVVTTYSNFSYPAKLITCVAPGGCLYDYWEYGRDYGITSTANTGSWTAVDGTSFAAPQVAALAAMLKAQLPSRTAADIRSLIISTCDHLSDSVYNQGNGRINVYSALGAYKTATPNPTKTMTPTISPTFTITSTITHTPTITPTPTITLTSTVTPTLTPSPTVTPMRLDNSEVRVFPQPAQDVMRIGFAYQGNGRVTVELYNVTGDRVLHFEDQPANLEGYSLISLATQKLSPGVYFLRITIEDANGSRVIQKKVAIKR